MFFAIKLHTADSQGHGDRAGDEHDSVDSPENDIEVFVGIVEHVGIERPIDSVGDEEAAEKQDFGDDENPHAQLGGFPLLGRVAEMMSKKSGMSIRMAHRMIS